MNLGDKPAFNGLSVDALLERAEEVILHREQSKSAPALNLPPDQKLRVGVDLGTAYLVLVVLDEDGIPLAGEWQFAQVAKDGLVVDFVGATDLLKGMKQNVERRLGRQLTHAASGYPPGVPQTEVRATAYVVEAAGMECTGLIDEPSAANNVLRLPEGVIVDVGGGTTGIALIQDGEVVFTADEATGGTHFSLVIAGSLGITFEEAEDLKTRAEEQARLLPVVRPVMEKVASITSRQLNGQKASSLTLVGGSSAFAGMARVVEEYSGIPTQVPHNPVFITPMGIALHDELS
ncbi:MAG: ethanolamine utilization protein EutJ [Anaerolineaceae bacterium]|nr:ethanolamine utilization protein EutJ [Anaerolineaceae bacterium]